MENDIDMKGVEILVREPKIPELPKMEEAAKVHPLPEIGEVPHGARHIHNLRRKAAIKPKVEERKKRQKRSRQCLHKAIVKPTSGHVSPRPNRHMGKK